MAATGKRSFWGRLLRINLSTRSTREEELREKDFALYIGGRGLGAALLYRELPPGIDPLGPENKLIFVTGPLVGTSAPSSSKYVIVTKSPLTGIYLMSISGRYFAAELKKTGYDAIIVEGKSATPVYIYLTSEGVQFKEALHLWGMSTELTERMVKAELGGKENRVACIGPAGENLVPYACVINDEGRAAGRGGAGAVMGSKNLKAIAVRGTRKIEYTDFDSYKQAVRRIYRETQQTSAAEHFNRYGTTITVDSMNALGIMPFKNWQYTGEGKASRLNGDTMRKEHWVKNSTCPPCIINCGKICKVSKGKFAPVVNEGPEYETIYAFGGSCCFFNLGAVIYADNICDSLGLDTMSTGISLSFAMECYERGILTKKDTGGLELTFGNDDLLFRLLHDIAYRRGFGAVIAEGVRKMAAQFGQGSERFAMHAKGMELGGYDPRGVKGMALVYACGARGGCHHAGGRTIGEEAKDGDYRFSTDGKGLLVKRSRDTRVAGDSAVVCNFSQIKLDALSELLYTSAGLEFSAAQLEEAGDRISIVERMFNVREGLRRSWDTLPARLTEEALPSGPSKGQTVNLEPLLDDFYKQCGWDLETGIPLRDKLISVGLESWIPELPK